MCARFFDWACVADDAGLGPDLAVVVAVGKEQFFRVVAACGDVPFIRSHSAETLGIVGSVQRTTSGCR